MPDGAQVGLRPVHPEDRDLLMEGFAALSEDSRYHRFLTPMSRLSERQARYLTELDQVNHFAWAIGVPDGAGGIQGVGVARYVRDRDDPSAAEIAVAITDDHQGRGLGGLLMRALGIVAAAHGIERLYGFTLAENQPMIRIFLSMGGEVHGAGSGLARVDVTLDPGVCDLGAEICETLIGAADRAAHPSAGGGDPPDHRG